jgi:hypothetical protein
MSVPVLTIAIHKPVLPGISFHFRFKVLFQRIQTQMPDILLCWFIHAAKVFTICALIIIMSAAYVIDAIRTPIGKYAVPSPECAPTTFLLLLLKHFFRSILIST